MKLIQDYRPLTHPGGKPDGLIFSTATSKQLRVFGDRLGVKRRGFLFLKEPAFLFKIRIRNRSIQLKDQGLTEWNWRKTKQSTEKD